MISAWWLLPALFAGVAIGFVLLSVMVVAGDADEAARRLAERVEAE